MMYFHGILDEVFKTLLSELKYITDFIEITLT